MKASYFVYGTKSSQECTIKRVVFQSTECGNDYIAYILNVDKDIVGNPLIASEKEIPLKYGNNYTEVNKSIKKSAAKESTENNYGFGNYNPIVYGIIKICILLTMMISNGMIRNLVLIVSFPKEQF